MHADAPTAAATNWAQIVAWYDLLMHAAPSPVVELNRAVAIAIVSTDRAKDLPHRPVTLRGAAWGGGVNLYNNGTTDLAVSPAKPIATSDRWAI